MFSPRSKTWTFPNLKTPAGPAEVYLAVEEEEEEPVSFGSPFRGVGRAVKSRLQKASLRCSIWRIRKTKSVILYHIIITVLVFYPDECVLFAFFLLENCWAGACKPELSGSLT